MSSSDERTASSGPDLEARLLLLLSRIRLEPEHVARARALIDEGTVRWGVFLERAARHKVLPLVGRHIAEHGLSRGDTGDGTQGIPFAWVYPTVLVGNRDRNHALADEALLVSRAFERHGLAHAMRKGLVVAQALYGDIGARRISDIDFLIARDDAPAADAALQDLGYVQGKITREGDRIERFSRATQIFWRTNLTNQLPYVKLGARPDLPVVNIDLCHALFQKDVADGDTTPEVLARAGRTPLGGGSMPRLEPVDELLDLCAHLHKEATGLLFVEQGVDLQISKFLDVSASASALGADAWDTVLGRVATSGQRRVIHYSLSFAEALYPGSVPPRVLDALRPGDLSHLDEYGAADGSPTRWDIPFPDRLFAEGPAGPSAAATSTVPHA
jgi:hypothetical protein